MSLPAFGDFGDCQQSIALGLHRLDLVEQQFEPVELAADLRSSDAAAAAAIAGLQLLQPLPPVAAQRLVASDALGEQQPLDAIDVPDPLTDQRPCAHGRCGGDPPPRGSAP